MRSDFQKRFRPLKRLKTLGSGGELLECVSFRSGKSYAIKVCSRQILDQDAVKREAVYREISTLRKLSHPNVANLIEAHQTDRSICLIYDLLDCETLHEVLQKNRKLSKSDIVAITKGLLQGVQHLQTRGVSHNRISPSNILLKKSGSKRYSPEDVVIVDFKDATCSAEHQLQNSGEGQNHSLDLRSLEEPVLQDMRTFTHASSIDHASCKSIMSLESVQKILTANQQQRSYCSDSYQIGKCVYSILSCGSTAFRLSGESLQSTVPATQLKLCSTFNASFDKKSGISGFAKTIESQLLAVAAGLVDPSECGQAVIEEALSTPLFQRTVKPDESEIQDQANEFRPRERFQST